MEILPGSATLHLASRHTFRNDWEGRLPATPNALLGWALACLLLAGEVALADDAIDLAAAEQQFLKSCGTCHAVEPNAPVRQGPNLRSIVGRTAGTLAEFPTYSDAVKKAGAGGMVWNEVSLEKWISGAAEFIPGSSMPYSQPDPAKRKLVIAYLKSLASGGGADKGK